MSYAQPIDSCHITKKYDRFIRQNLSDYIQQKVATSQRNNIIDKATRNLSDFFLKL